MVILEQRYPDINSEGIIEVETNEDFEKWIETFIKSYPKDDPQNPYGEQAEFAEVLKKARHENKENNEKYYLLFDKDKPVATAILASYDNMGWIYGVGSIPSARGKGFGKKISLHCVKESIKLKNKHHCLATEKGHYPYEFYKKIGFTPEFVAFLYSKK